MIARRPDRNEHAPTFLELVHERLRNVVRRARDDDGIELAGLEQRDETTLQVASIDRIVFGTDWPYAALPESGDPAPELAALGAGRALVDAGNVRALVPHLLLR